MRIIRQFLAVLLAAAAIAVLVFLIRLTQSVDGELHLERLEAIQRINDLDVALNRAVTLNRVSTLALASEDKLAIIAELGDAMDVLDKEGRLSLRGLSPEIDAALDEFLITAGDKFVLAFDFDIRYSQVSQRLIRSVDAVPIFANQARALLPEDSDTARTLARLQSEVMAVTVSAALEDQRKQAIDAYLAELKQAAQAAQSEQPELAQAISAARSATYEVLGDKAELQEKLDAFFATPTAEQLQALEDQYSQWHEARVALANQYRLYLAGYAGFLLIVLVLLGLRLIRSFRDLDKANAALSEANEHLEEQVAERTQDLSSALDELKSSQAQLIQSEKMASLGQMVAGVAHEINTPLGYARGNADIVKTSLSDIREVCAAQHQALNMVLNGEGSEEDMAQALGRAHQLSGELMPLELLGDLDNLLQDTEHGLHTIAELVASLKDFSRVDRSRNDLFDVNQGIESALKICQNSLKSGIEVKKVYGQLPEIECSPSQVNQIFLNIINNAAQAIESTGREDGRIFIHTQVEGDDVVVRVLDNGCGMSEEVQQKIFEPFFTTKPVGHGTGLGMSIIFRIIEDHGGSIAVKSKEGKGSEMIVRLPCKQPATAHEEQAEEPIEAVAA